MVRDPASERGGGSRLARVLAVTSNFYWLTVGILVVWRITHLFYGEDGPWGIMVRLRRAAGDGFWASLLDCFYCLSLWVAVPFAALLGEGWSERLMLWPALSGGAIVLERLTAKIEHRATVCVTGNEESDNVLRQEQNDANDRNLRSDP